MPVNLASKVGQPGVNSAPVYQVTLDDTIVRIVPIPFSNNIVAIFPVSIFHRSDDRWKIDHDFWSIDVFIEHWSGTILNNGIKSSIVIP